MKKIPIKNYIILSLILLVTFSLLYYFYLWFSAYKEHLVQNSIMDEQLRVINYNDLNNYVVENDKVYIYVSYTSDEKIMNFEKDLSVKLRKEKLNNKLLYLDVTNQLNGNVKLEYDLKKDNLPTILIFKNSSLEGVYNIKKNQYNSSKTIAYLISKDIKDL